MIKLTRHLVPMLIVFALLVACRENEEHSQLKGGNGDYSTATVTSEEIPFTLSELSTDVIKLPVSDKLSGGLLLAVNEDERFDRLYYAKFDGQPAQLLTERVVSFLVFPSPYAPLVTYPSHDGRRWRFVITDLRTMETVEMINGDSSGEIHGWSPDGQSLSFQTREQGLMIYDIPSNTTTQVTEQPATSAWLQDNTLVYVLMGEDDTSLPLIRYFPEEGRHERLIDNVSVTPPNDFIALEAVLSEQDLRFAAGFDQYDRRALAPGRQSHYVIDWSQAVWNDDVIVCEPWKITEYAHGSDTSSVAYAAEDIHFLTDLNILENGDLLFLQWEIEDCTFGHDMTVSLMRVDPTGAVNAITDEIYAGTNQAVRSHRYTTGEGFAFWIGQRPTGDTIINATELATGNTAPLLTIKDPAFSIFDNIFYVADQKSVSE
jgi:hypothetical protein